MKQPCPNDNPNCAGHHAWLQVHNVDGTIDGQGAAYCLDTRGAHVVLYDWRAVASERDDKIDLLQADVADRDRLLKRAAPILADCFSTHPEVAALLEEIKFTVGAELPESAGRKPEGPGSTPGASTK